MIVLAAIYPEKVNLYPVRHAFLDNFGRRLQWWATILLELMTLVVMELVVQSIRRVYWPTDQDLMQRMEKDSDIKSIFKDNATAAEQGVMNVEHDDDDDDGDEDRGRSGLAVPRQSREPSGSPRVSVQGPPSPMRMSHDDYRHGRATPAAEGRENPMERLARINSQPT